MGNPGHDRPPADLSPEQPQRPDDQDDDNTTQGWYAMAGVGIEFLAAILLPGWLGWWLDGRLGSRPWLMIGCGAIGFAAGMWLLVKAARGIFKQ